MRLFLIAAAVAAAVSADIKEEKDVLVLTSDNFDEAVKEHDPLLVAFVAPWCGHCKSLKPEYEKAAKVLKADNVRIAKVDATAHQDLATKFDVSGFPTIKFFRGGQPSEYNGGRDKDSIVSWVRKRSGPATTTVTTSAQLESLTQGHDVVVIGFVSAADSATAAAVSSVAAAHDDAPFALVIGSEGEAADIRTKYGVGAEEEAVVAANNFVGQENIVRFSGEAGAEALGAWVAANSLPLVVVFSQETAPKIFRGDMKTHFLLFADEGEDAGAEHTAALAAFRAAAAANPGRCLFVRVPSSEDRVLGYFGISGDNLPAAVLVNMGEEGMKKYKFTDAFAPESFTAFLDAYAAGTLKAWLKSEPAPNAEENAAAPVRVITGETFRSEVVDSDADVLLEVYAPWCGHCKALMPTWEALGKASKAVAGGKLVIAKMDGTANEIDYPGVNVKGFPTILFFKGDSKAQPIDYDGSRDMAGFVNFIKSHAANDVSALEADEDAEVEEQEEA